MLLNDVFEEQLIRLNLEGKTKEAVFTELIEAIAKVRPEFDSDEMLAVIQDRENKLNTSVAPGVAVPHGYYPGTGDVIGAIGISRAGIDYGAPDNKPVQFIFLVIMGEASREKHLRILSRVLSLINSGALADIEAAGSPQEVYDILSRFS
ncbi:PTS fructose transporter subunit IIA [Spirochaetia bacterium]|nr:PTS fructose transporter subunit IIA [Spirochaetia bacterium]